MYNCVCNDCKDRVKDDDVAVDAGLMQELRSSYTAGHVEDYYDVKQELGHGSFGRVLLGIPRGSWVCIRPCAIKTLCKSNKANKSDGFLFGEIDALSDVSHPNIIKLHEVFEDEGAVHLVTEMCTGGCLSTLIKEKGSFSEALCAHVMRQALRAVCYLHRKFIAHRDLKPSNVVLHGLGDAEAAPPTCKVVDFGLARRFRPSAPMSDFVGSATYVAPEVLRGRYTHACDIWSLGILMYKMLCGYLPFEAETEAATLKLVVSGHMKFQGDDWRDKTGFSKEMIRQLAQRSVDRRLTAAQALRHDWFLKGKDVTCIDSHSPVRDGQLVAACVRMFQGMSKLKKLILYVIASRVEAAEIRELTELYLQLEWKSKGLLPGLVSRRHVAAALSLQEAPDCNAIDAGQEKSTAAAAAAAAAALAPGDYMDYWHFLAAALPPSCYLREEVLREAFTLFDSRDVGSVSEDDIKRMARAVSTRRSTLAPEFTTLLEELSPMPQSVELSFCKFEQFMQASAEQKHSPDFLQLIV